MRVFNFDDDRVPDPVPAGWDRTTLSADGQARAGFPKFNRAEFDDQVSFSGKRSVRLPTAGGSTALRLKPGEAAVFADADYAISARIRTDGLEHARAFITVRLLDQHLRPITGSEIRSEPVHSPGAWRAVTVNTPGGGRGAGAAARGGEAAWIQIDLELLQPRQFLPPASDDPAAKALEQHRLYREDVRGSAWFDDIAIVQIPRASITTESPGNIVAAEERPALRITVRDLGGVALAGRVRVFDIRGRTVHDSTSDLAPDGRAFSLTPKLSGRGWYSARLDVFTAGEDRDASAAEPVSWAQTAFVWLARPPGVAASAEFPLEAATPAAGEPAGRPRAAAALEADRARFGLVLHDTADEHLGDVPPLLARLATGHLTIPAWRADSTLAGAADSLAARRAAIELLLRQGQTITFSLDGVPTELSRETGAPADDALALAAIPAAEWLGYLSPTLDIFGQRVLRYQLGTTGADHAWWRKDLASDLESIESVLATLVPGPTISLPWPADRQPPIVDRPPPAPSAAGSRQLGAAAARQPGLLLDALAIDYPVGFDAGEVGATLAAIARDLPPASRPELTLVLRLPPSRTYGSPAGILELMRRTVEFWRTLGDGAAPDSAATGRTGGGSQRLAIVQPWRWSRESTPQVLPEPQLATLSVLMERLSGRRIVGELTNSPGVKCYILAARNTGLGTLERGALVAWNESAEPDRAIVDAAAVGAAVLVVDAFGNVTTIPVGMSSEDRGGSAPSPLVTVPVGETPVFIEGIDPYLALFAASFRLEPSFMPAVVREHEHRITLANPWPVRVTGKLQLKEDAERSARMRRTVTDEWKVAPSGIVDFDIAPGQTISLPVTLSFGPGQLAGVKDFLIIARPMADRAYPPIRLHASVEVGLEDIEMTPELQVSPGGDVVVVAAITNKGVRPRTLRLETASRNVPSQQLQISDLPPGQTVLRRFVFKDGASQLSGKRILVSLSDFEEAQRLNKALLVP